MCLSMVWYLQDTDSESGGTWIVRPPISRPRRSKLTRVCPGQVPGSHRDLRNPRGPADGINTQAPIPHNIQVAAPAGSVLIQDTRCWHCQAMHNFSGRTRYAIVNRWAPWWLSVSEFGRPHGNRSYFTPEEYEALPESIHPLFAHMVRTAQQQELEEAELEAKGNFNLIQPLNQARAAAAGQRAQEGFWPDTPEGSNSHVIVRLRPAAL